jgi:transcriptional regulator with XRE-family HTH domain
MTELAQRSGLSRAMISFIESEFRNPSLDTLLRVCGALKIELAEIIKKASVVAAKTRPR